MATLEQQEQQNRRVGLLVSMLVMLTGSALVCAGLWLLWGPGAALVAAGLVVAGVGWLAYEAVDET